MIEAERGRLEGLGYVFAESATENYDGAVRYLVQVTLDDWFVTGTQYARVMVSFNWLFRFTAAKVCKHHRQDGNEDES